MAQRSSDRGRTSHAERDRQWLAGTHGGRGGTSVSGPTGEGDGVFWFFQRTSFAPDEAARDRSVCAGQQSATRDEDGRTGRRLGCVPHPRSGTSVHAGEVTEYGGTSLASPAAGSGGAGVRNPERSTRDEEVSEAWTGGSDHRMDAGRHRLQPHPHSARLSEEQQCARTHNWRSAAGN